MELIIRPYEALPCALEYMEINGKRAYAEDFGSGCDHREVVDTDQFDEDLIEWGCCNHYWTRNNDLIDDTCKKYNITYDEFAEICDALEEVLHVGSCGWCI